MNEKILENIGLTKGEIKVYLALLRIGETTTGKIIEEARISSGKVYEILNKLINKGLASYILKDKTKYFIPSSPKRILNYVEEKQQQLTKDKKEVENELPALLSLQKLTKKGHDSRLFTGIEGYRTVIFNMLSELNQGDEILVMGVISTKGIKYESIWKLWHKERVKKKIVCKMIFSDKKTSYYEHFKDMKYTKVRLLKGVTPAAIDIVKDKALIFTHGKNPSVLLIDNSEVAQSFRTFFNSLWDISKK